MLPKQVDFVIPKGSPGQDKLGGIPMLVTWRSVESVSKASHHTTNILGYTIIYGSTYGFTMVLLWFYYIFSMVFLWFCWFYYGFITMVLPWF